jgi:ketosteroid isomerase-like protein
MTIRAEADQRGSEAKTVLRCYLDALTAGDLDAVAASFADDATWSVHGTMPLSGTRQGRDAIMEFLTSAGALYQPGTQSFTFGEITAEADRAVLEKCACAASPRRRAGNTTTLTAVSSGFAMAGLPRSASTSTRSTLRRSFSRTPAKECRMSRQLRSGQSEYEELVGSPPKQGLAEIRLRS